MPNWTVFELNGVEAYSGRSHCLCAWLVVLHLAHLTLIAALVQNNFAHRFNQLTRRFAASAIIIQMDRSPKVMTL